MDENKNIFCIKGQVHHLTFNQCLSYFHGFKLSECSNDDFDLCSFTHVSNSGPRGLSVLIINPWLLYIAVEPST